MRRFSKNILAQVIEYNPDGDKVIVSAHTNELKKKYGMTKQDVNQIISVAGTQGTLGEKAERVLDAKAAKEVEKLLSKGDVAAFISEPIINKAYSRTYIKSHINLRISLV